MEFVGKLGGLTRNPLGIIALFISLIYGMSAILLGASVGSLSSINQTILVAFIASFPFVVLGVFSWLVAKHHSKLYGPGDYRSDEGFLKAGVAPPNTIGTKLREELEEAAVAENEAPNPVIAMDSAQKDSTASNSNRQIPNSSISAGSIYSGSITVSSHDVSQAFIAQNLAVQEIQGIFGGLLLKEARIGSRAADAIIQTNNGIVIVEVKNFFSPNITTRRVMQWFKNLEDLMQAASSSGGNVASGVLVVITDAHGFSSKQLRELSSLSPSNIMVKIFDRDDLFRRYNLPTYSELTADDLQIR